MGHGYRYTKKVEIGCIEWQAFGAVLMMVHNLQLFDQNGVCLHYSKWPARNKWGSPRRQHTSWRVGCSSLPTPLFARCPCQTWRTAFWTSKLVVTSSTTMRHSLGSRVVMNTDWVWRPAEMCLATPAVCCRFSWWWRIPCALWAKLCQVSTSSWTGLPRPSTLCPSLPGWVKAALDITPQKNSRPFPALSKMFHLRAPYWKPCPASDPSSPSEKQP